jgi:hypothetical protein
MAQKAKRLNIFGKVNDQSRRLLCRSLVQIPCRCNAHLNAHLRDRRHFSDVFIFHFFPYALLSALSRSSQESLNVMFTQAFLNPLAALVDCFAGASYKSFAFAKLPLISPGSFLFPDPIMSFRCHLTRAPLHLPV